VSIRASHFRHLLVQPVLEVLGKANPALNSEAAANLLMGTAAQESKLGHYMHQLGGPAMGPFQIEDPTYQDTLGRYLGRDENSAMRDAVESFLYRGTAVLDSRQLITNMPLGCAIARIKFWMAPEALPEAEDIEGLADYWKRHYNTMAGAGTSEEFMASYEKYVGND